MESYLWLLLRHNFQGIQSRERTLMRRQEDLDKAEKKNILRYVMTQTKLT